MPHPSGRPWIIAHRGASAARPENTIPAFRHAAALGADAVEFDVRRTRDGVAIVRHDPLIDGTPIISMKRAEVSAAEPEIPDFEDAVAACAGMWIDVEIKNALYEPDWDPSDNALGLIAGNLPPDALVTSFNPATVKRARAMGMRTGWLLSRSIDPVRALNDWPGHEFALPSITAMRPDAARAIVTVAQDHGAEVAVWTVDDPAEIIRLARVGVGAVCTNTPDVALGALTAMSG